MFFDLLLSAFMLVAIFGTGWLIIRLMDTQGVGVVIQSLNVIFALAWVYFYFFYR